MNIDFKRLLTLLLPTFLRKEVLLSFLNAISEAFQESKNDIDIYFNKMNIHVCVTPQTFSLEKMLNDWMDSDLRRIYIEIPEPGPPFYFYEGNEESTYMKYFNGDDGIDDEFFLGDNTGYTHGFTVFVPLELEEQYPKPFIDALLDKYKILSNSHIIKYV